MKKILQSSFFRAVAAIAVGILLIKFPDNTVKGITIAIGLLFLISGLVSVLTYWIARRHLSEYKIYDAEGREVTNEMPAFPIVGIGSMLLGGSLALMPSTFVSALMYVIGATKAEMLTRVRELAPNHFLLVPGVGAQGDSLEEVCKYGMNKDCGLLVNSSRGIIFASNGEDFAEVAGEKARELAEQMDTELQKAGL